MPLLIAITALPAVTINIYLPSMPGLVAHFRTDTATIQHTLSLYLLGLAIGGLAFGPLSDRFGRRPMLLAGMAVYALGSLLCAMAPGIGTFLLGRLLQALGGAAGTVIGRAMVGDVYGETRVASILGYTVMVTTVATAVAPIIGGTLDGLFSWRGPFLFLGCLGALVLVAALTRAQETATLTARRSGSFWTGYAQVLRHRRFWRFVLLSSLMNASYFVFIAGSPIIVIELWRYSLTSFGAWWLVVSLSYFLGSFLAGRFSQRVGTEGMLRIGLPITLLGAGLLIVLLAIGPHHPLAIFLPIGIIFIGSGAIQPSIVAAAINAAPAQMGAASGLLGCIQILAGILAISLLGQFPSNEPLFFGAICSGAIVLGIVINIALKRHANRSK